MINAVGLQNPGVHHVTQHELPELKKIFHKPVIANVSGFSVEDYAYTCQLLDKEEQVGILEVNVSCPNVHGGGMSFGTDPACAAEVTRAVKAVTTKPVFIKLSPNVTDIVAIAKACEEAGADGICLINTLLGMRIDLNRRRPVIANTMGGFSGPAVFPVYGVPGGQCLQHSRDGLRRRYQCPGCGGDDDGRCHGCTGRRCQFGRPLRLQKNH